MPCAVSCALFFQMSYLNYGKALTGWLHKLASITLHQDLALSLGSRKRSPTQALIRLAQTGVPTCRGAKKSEEKQQIPELPMDVAKDLQGLRSKRRVASCRVPMPNLLVNMLI